MKLVALALGFTLLLSVNPQPSFAGCIPLTLAFDVNEGRPNGKILITGKGFIDKCTDVSLTGAPLPAPLPIKGIRILFVQGNTIEEIGLVDADENTQLSARITVPNNARGGIASIVFMLPLTGRKNGWVAREFKVK